MEKNGPKTLSPQGLSMSAYLVGMTLRPWSSVLFSTLLGCLLGCTPGPELDLIDAINLTVSPQLIGGAGQRMIESTDEHAYRFRLQHAVTDGDCLFTRWLRRSEAAS